jgi:carbon storage regulator
VLILTRKVGEGFWVNDETEVIVLGYQGNCVKLGVCAPRNVLILRSELKLVEQQNRAAVRACSAAAIDDLAARFRKS